MKSVIDIGSGSYYLSVKDNHLIFNQENEEVRKVFLNTIEAIVVHSPAITYSQNMLVELAERNIPLIICDRYHMPIAQMFYYQTNYIQKERLMLQLNATSAKKNGIWKEVIKLKIREQAKLLTAINSPFANRLNVIAKDVVTGDVANCEGLAANIYFPALFGKNFKRERQFGESINSFLNYGYIILRSAMARAIFVAGLNPSLGIFHKNVTNYFCLVDDLMEPFRIAVDSICYNNYHEFSNAETLTPIMKQKLSSVLQSNVLLHNQELILSDAMQKFVYSFISALEQTSPRIKLDFPKKVIY